MSALSALVDEIHATLNDPTVSSHIGRRSVTKHEQARRIVWVRGTNSSVSVADDMGGKLVTNDDASQSRGTVIYTMNESIEAHIYAEDETALEHLFSNLLAAMKATLGAGWSPGHYEWQTETGSDGVNTGYAVRGAKIKFDSVWMIPSTDEIQPLTTILGQTHVCIIETPDGTGFELE